MIDTSKVDIRKDHVLEALQRHVGRENGVHMRDLVGRILNTVLVTEAHERKVRELITDLRNDGHHICAHPGSGYYMAANAKELEDTCRFLLERSQSTVDQVCRMRGAFAIDLYQQVGLSR
ncbi:hypothetical protein ACO2Q9_02715 [Variovorax sp. VNK109]|uniref:hypothetical protein n=1 Tax=Variovorax sp. VNK109 TaxID=3400919 RepID=UPI003C05A6DF